MIDDSVLESLIPKGEPELEDVPPWYELSREGQPLAERAERWCIAIQLRLRRYMQEHFGAKEHTGLEEHPGAIGIGFFDAPGSPDLSLSAQSLSFGVVFYSGYTAMESEGPGGAPVVHPDLEVGGEWFPVVGFPADFGGQARLGNGRCSAVVGRPGAAHLMTARHCVEGLSLGAPVDVTCVSCGARETAALAMQGHIYLDVALLRRPAKACDCSFHQTSQVLYGRRAMKVRLHDGTFAAARSATIMQGIGPPSAIINGARPQTFLTDIHSGPGASGCAVSCRHDQRADALVGSYSGMLTVGTAPGTAVARGYAQCADEALRLFGCRLMEGIW